MNNNLIIVAFLIWLEIQRATLATPQPQSTPEPTPVPTQSTPVVTQQVTAAGGLKLGMAGRIQCYNCAPFTQKVNVTNYDPMEGPINCFDYADNYCYSPTSSGIHWKAVYGFGAACPMDWPFGTWVDIPGVGAFICFDRGGEIGCNAVTGVCAVDLLGPGGPWNKQTFTATLWVPLNPPRKVKK